MSFFESDGIILRSYNLSEADRIVLLYTHDHGLIRGVAKGARRLKSKFGSSLEPFCEVRIEFYQKEDRELVSIRHAELIRSAFATASQPELLGTLSHFADLLQEFTPPHDANKVLYRMLRACIAVELLDPQEHEALKLYFETWLMRLGGYLPDWTVCGLCNRAFTSSEAAWLLSGFRLACGECVIHGTPNETVSPPERKLLSAIQHLAPDEFTKDPDMRSVRNVRAIMGKIISASSGREPISLAKNASAQRPK